MNYESKLPCPLIKVEKRNPYYAKLLLEDYAGESSEDTAIHLYVYQSLVTSEKYQEYKNILMPIARVEMNHLRILGELITLLGLKPIYGTIENKDKVNFWTSSNVGYNIDIKAMLELDIERETNAIKNYKHHQSIINDKYIYKILDKIIADEKVHLDIFKELYQKYL